MNAKLLLMENSSEKIAEKENTGLITCGLQKSGKMFPN
jgi:hypothetical protein